MGKPPKICPVLETKRDKRWPYTEYYFGERDKEHRRSGAGENHWTGAESLEWYTGHFVRDAMNGCGEYRWRYYGREGVFVTYEGRFYANAIHGYGTMSYPDGRVFTGLYHKNMRWGPGIESHINLGEDVGFWRGTQLVRLAWRPEHPSVTLDFITGSNGKAYVERYRVLLARNTKSIGATNSAIDLLKQNGADPVLAAEIWPKLYLKHSTDPGSKACYVDAFDFDYYRGNIHSLEEVTNLNLEQLESESQESRADDVITYFAWNNGDMMLQMMKHCYKHDSQRKTTKIDLEKILNGSRMHFKRPGKHEQDCRTVLMCSYLGRIANVARLINEHDVHPDIADNQGNTALMYAAAADQSVVVHFLAEAGANVNCYNDSCCTALGIALMRFVCMQRDVPPNGMVQALLPRAAGSPARLKTSDWYINREQPQDLINKVFKSVSKTTRISSVRKVKSQVVVRETTSEKNKSDTTPPRKSMELQYDTNDSPSEDKLELYYTTDNEYSITVNNLFIGPNMNVPYIFEVHNMVTDIDTAEELPKQITDKVPNKKESKVFRNIKPSKDNLWNANPDEITSLSSAEKLKYEILSKVMLTILQLLADGANPRLVRCPKPALFIAVASGSPELVRNLVRYGADVNEQYPETLNYTAIDVAISYPFTTNNVLLIRELLVGGASANHRLQFPDEPGPTLLHAVLSRKTESIFEEHICRQILELLLEYDCNPANQFKGRSAIDVAMTRNMEFFGIFVKSPKTKLNEVVNSLNQSILVKMFSFPFSKHISGIDRLPILTNLLLYGADPLIQCQDGEDKFRNIFAYAKKTLAAMESGTPPGLNTGTDIKSLKNVKSEVKTDQKGKSVKGKASSAKSIGRLVVAADEINDYKQAVDLMTECARILHIRWLQAKLMKELVAVIYKYKHRPWNMIIKEHKTKRNVALWLTPQRCLEISDIMKAAKKKPYQDLRLLSHLLCIVQFYNNRFKINQSITANMTFREMCMVELDVERLIKEHKIVSKLSEEAEAWKGLYVKPELAIRADEKFGICFECALPVDDNTKISCQSCGLVAFCSTSCLKSNIDRNSCHPCSDYLRKVLFPDSIESVL